MSDNNVLVRKPETESGLNILFDTDTLVLRNLKLPTILYYYQEAQFE